MPVKWRRRPFLESMLKKASCAASLTGAALASLSLIFVDGKSASAVSIFNVTSSSSTNSSSIFRTDGGFSLTASNSNSTGNNPNTLNTTDEGLCAFTAVGNVSIGRCGYGDDSASGVSAFQLSFNAPAAIQAFNVSTFEDFTISQGTVGFSLDNVNFTDFNFNSTGSVAASFSAGANQPIFVRTSATFSNVLNTGLFRIDSFTVEEVPGPLPILGAAGAFGWSRKLKRKQMLNS